MHPAILGFALGTRLVALVSDRVPKLNVEANCKGTVADDTATVWLCLKAKISA